VYLKFMKTKTCNKNKYCVLIRKVEYQCNRSGTNTSSQECNCSRASAKNTQKHHLQFSPYQILTNPMFQKSTELKNLLALSFIYRPQMAVQKSTSTIRRPKLSSTWLVRHFKEPNRLQLTVRSTPRTSG